MSNELGELEQNTPNMRIVVILRDSLAMWQKVNVTAFLISGISIHENTIGKPYIDASGQRYNPMITDPVMAYSVTDEEIKQAHAKALSRKVNLSIFTEDIFKTFNDVDNRAVVAAVNSEDLKLVGIAFRDKKNAADKIVKRMALLS